MNVLTPKQYCVMKQWFSSEYRICKHFCREFDALLSNRPKGSRGSNQRLSMTRLVIDSDSGTQVRFVEEAGLPSGFSTVVCRGENVLAPVGSHKLVSAAVRCAWPSWRHSKVKRATGRIFENGGVIVFHVNTLSLFFPVSWSSNVVSLLIEDTIALYSNGRGKCILITKWKFCKKGFWRV